MTIDNITYVVINGQRKYTIDVTDGENILTIGLPLGVLTRAVVINTIVRYKYSQDSVEAIINNHFINISEWLDAKFKGEDIEFIDPDYVALQEWRKKSKDLADLIIAEIDKLD